MTYLLSLFLVFPAPSFVACSNLCGSSLRVDSYDGAICHCAPRRTKAERFCDSCALRCGLAGVRSCTFQGHLLGRDAVSCECWR
jgi:hypothetical protein